MTRKIRLGDQPCKQEACSYWENCPFARDIRRCVSTPHPEIPLECLEEIS